MTKRLTRQQAINQNCKDCIWDQKAPGTWKQQVEACEIASCPFYPYRPKSDAGARESTKKGVK